jgi:hypothetical protein
MNTFLLLLQLNEMPPSTGFRSKIKVAGTFIAGTPKLKVSGVFVNRAGKVKIGGVFT